MFKAIVSGVGLGLILYLILRRFQRRVSIAHIVGPPSTSWLSGNWVKFLKSPAGEADFEWQTTYGDIVRLRAPFGEDRLLITDPKAIHYIYHSFNYNFPKPTGRRAIIRAAFGPGLTNIEGEEHKRARKLMVPAFGSRESNSYLPIFFNVAGKMVQKWQDLIAIDPDQTVVIDVPHWVSRAALDAIGEAAFDYQFGALDDSKNALTTAYANLFVDTFGKQTTASAIISAALDDIPEGVADFIVRRLPIRKFARGFQTRRLSEAVAKELIEEKMEALLQGVGRRDVMTSLVQANNSVDPKTRLGDEQLLAQMNITIIAGHETTANTLSFTLIELCKNPAIQTRLRKEICSMARTKDITALDFEQMPYLTAVVKETLRFHPIIYNTYRIAGGDDILPLLTPITAATGEVLTEIPIAKGTMLITSVAAYNRNKSIFGEDADVYNPDRWLREDVPKTKVPMGVYASLFTFVGGPRSCIGWRFAVLELNAFLIETLSKFEFELHCSPDDIRREASNVMAPTLGSERSKGAQLPLRIRMVSDDC